MKLREATEADLPAIVAIFNATIPSRMVTAQLASVTVEERRAWFREHSPAHYPIWVAEVDGAIVGWLSCSSFLTRCAYRGTAEVSVYVDEKFRRRGVGAGLLAAAIERAPALELTALVGLIFAHNEPSLQLFARFGFARWGHLPKVARLDDFERDLVIVGRNVATLPNE